MPVEANKSYAITVWIGRRNGMEGSAAGILTVYLEDVVLNSRLDEETFDLISLGQGNWIQQTLTLSTGGNPSGQGNPLHLGFINEGTRGARYWYGQVVLDDVSLTEL